MSDITIYHNPRCSRSRQTLALIQERGIEPNIVEYLQTPPDLETLRQLLAMLNLAPRALTRVKEEVYQTEGLADVDDEALLAAMTEHPILIERPVVVRGERAIVGRPPENVLELLD